MKRKQYVNARTDNGWCIQGHVRQRVGDMVHVQGNGTCGYYDVWVPACRVIDFYTGEPLKE